MLHNGLRGFCTSSPHHVTPTPRGYEGKRDRFGQPVCDEEPLFAPRPPADTHEWVVVPRRTAARG